MSNVWAGISSQASNIIKGTTSAMGNGQRTLFWDHSWVEAGTLSDSAVMPIPHNLLGETVSDMWDEEHGWKWDVFAIFLPRESLLKIASYSLSSDPNLVDSLYWNGTSHGKFSIKSAMNIIKALEPFPETNQVQWHVIWKLPVQQRIKFFIWLAAHGRAMCNVNRVRRNLSNDPSCPRCQAHEETMDHVLRYCPISREVWSSLGIPNSSNAFYSPSFADWISLNATNKMIVGMQDWSMKFAITCWWIWRWRNNIAFGRPNDNPIRPIDLLHQQFEASKNAFDKFSLFVPLPGSIRNEIFIRWHPPPHGWCLLNTDGASKGNPGPAGCGGVFRDETGNFISAYLFSGGVCTSMRAEMLALVAGLERAKELHIDKLVVHMDNAKCVKMVLEDQLSSNSLRHLVHRSKELIKFK